MVFLWPFYRQGLYSLLYVAESFRKPTNKGDTASISEEEFHNTVSRQLTRSWLLGVSGVGKGLLEMEIGRVPLWPTEWVLRCTGAGLMEGTPDLTQFSYQRLRRTDRLLWWGISCWRETQPPPTWRKKRNTGQSLAKMKRNRTYLLCLPFLMAIYGVATYFSLL